VIPNTVRTDDVMFQDTPPTDITAAEIALYGALLRGNDAAQLEVLSNPRLWLNEQVSGALGVAGSELTLGVT